MAGPTWSPRIQNGLSTAEQQLAEEVPMERGLGTWYTWYLVHRTWYTFSPYLLSKLPSCSPAVVEWAITGFGRKGLGGLTSMWL